MNYRKINQNHVIYGENESYFFVIYAFAGPNSANYGKNDENKIFNGDFAIKF